MSHIGKKRPKIEMVRRGGSNLIDAYGVFKWDGVPVQFTTHAKMHLDEFKLDAREIVEMLRYQVKCPKISKHKKSETEVCSYKNGQIFRIILFETYCFDVGRDCWCVKNVKPA
jgi:hypothetical protein